VNGPEWQGLFAMGSTLDGPTPQLEPIVVSRLIQPFCLLIEAHQFARDAGCNAWDFAVDVEELRKAGLSNNGLRWLIRKGYVCQAVEVTKRDAPNRSFRPMAELCLGGSTCVILSPSGLAFAADKVLSGAAAPDPVAAPSIIEVLVPKWDNALQELRVGQILIKAFKVPAPNQEVILAAFEEERWPPRIDDPLAPVPGLEAKRRLHETITSLNRNQRHPLISFHGDGSGQGVRWRHNQHSAPRNGRISP
jgi:hypothetical protein